MYVKIICNVSIKQTKYENLKHAQIYLCKFKRNHIISFKMRWTTFTSIKE